MMFTVQGMPRSGTTLLAQCLNAHPALVVPDETDFMVPAAHAFNLIDDADVGRAFLADLITATARFEVTLGRWLTAERVGEVIAAAPYRFDALIASLYEALAVEAGATLAGDKSPNDLAQSEVLGHAGFFTGDVRTVHLVRDPRERHGVDGSTGMAERTRCELRKPVAQCQPAPASSAGRCR